MAWRRVAFGLVLAGCGGGWSSVDAKSATDAVRLELQIETVCAPDAGCAEGPVRAMERAAYCANASMLARHGAPVADGGIACVP